MSGARHELDLSVEELLTAIIRKCGGELEITVDDAINAKGLKLAINPGETNIMLKVLSPAEVKLFTESPIGGKH